MRFLNDLLRGSGPVFQIQRQMRSSLTPREVTVLWEDHRKGNCEHTEGTTNTAAHTIETFIDGLEAQWSNLFLVVCVSISISIYSGLWILPQVSTSFLFTRKAFINSPSISLLQLNIASKNNVEIREFCFFCLGLLHKYPSLISLPTRLSLLF